MSNNQLHGKKFEELVLDVLGLAEVDGRAPKPTDMFDIPLVTSMKRAGSLKLSKGEDELLRSTVYLSDACRVWSWGHVLNMQTMGVTEPTYPSVRLIAGLYDQDGRVKRVHTVYDLVLELSPQVLEGLYGSVTLAVVYAFHMGIREEFFPDPDDARAWADRALAALQGRLGCITLNRKIDSKSQRRLQCSAPLAALVSLAGNPTPHTDNFFGLKLPFEIQSSARQRNPRPAEPTAP